jgi:hypothetical protein
MPMRTGIAMAISGDAPGWLTGKAPRPAAKSPQQRKKLWELPRNLHCSVIGTCLPTPELRKVLDRFADVDLRRMSELELHEQGVTAAGRHDDVGRSIHKALDRRHYAVVRKFGRAGDAAQLRGLWLEAKQHGDLPGAYWATLTHPAATDLLVHEVFGEVHMLSHLVGAANRTALSRLAELDEEKADLEIKIEKQQERCKELVQERDAIGTRLDELLLARAAGDAQPAIAPDQELAALRELVEGMQQRLAAESARRERAEQKRDEARLVLAQTQNELAQTREREAALGGEVAALETLLDEGDEAGMALPVAAGTTILYVGGRPAQVEQIRARMVAGNAQLLDHDGGLQERVGMLAGLISRADLVVFPVDCISHGAMHAVKRLCGQAGKPYLPLRSAGLASFIGGLAQAPLLAARGREAMAA